MIMETRPREDIDSDLEFSDDGIDYDYYNEPEDVDQNDVTNNNPEHFKFDCLVKSQVECLLNESITTLSADLHIKPALAKGLLQHFGWHRTLAITQYRKNPHEVLVNAHFEPAERTHSLATSLRNYGPYMNCDVCITTRHLDHFLALNCGHLFCKCCWLTYLSIQIGQGISTGISCMANSCYLRATEEFVLENLASSDLQERYLNFAFKDYVNSHHHLRFCPGLNCPIIIFALEPPKPKRTTCSHCKTIFCFKCGNDYHAPTDCSTIRRWLIKCADDSETANYITANTKDCPKCHICIEKNGGCNHMQCYNCKHDFCWMCLGEWKNHGSEYYECSRYKYNPNVSNESTNALAREALKKYLHYYGRYENHSKSLKLEQQTVEILRQRINQKVMANLGTWIDWEYLFTAAALLARCRYTLQYTYPYAYYMELGPRKELFEYQQAQLEAEIENLSWKIERAETTDRGDLENQMDIAEKRRSTLLKDFFEL